MTSAAQAACAERCRTELRDRIIAVLRPGERYGAGGRILALSLARQGGAHYIFLRMPAPDLDKRKGKTRIKRRLSVRFGTDAKMCGGTVVDISEGGMRIESPESFPVNSVVTVFVQFPRHSVRLRAKIIWSSGAGGAGSAGMGLALSQPVPALKQAYAEWVAEVKQAAAEDHAAGASAPATTPATPAPAPLPAAAATGAEAPALQPAAPEPQGPIRRRLESRQGQSYDALLERQPPGWRLVIVQLPRQLGVGTPDLDSTCPDYASAEKTLREFVRTH